MSAKEYVPSALMALVTSAVVAIPGVRVPVWPICAPVAGLSFQVIPVSDQVVLGTVRTLIGSDPVTSLVTCRRTEVGGADSPDTVKVR
jgi:hypothetical protein